MQLIRGPNFGKVPRQPSLPLVGSQERRQDGSQRPGQNAAAAPAAAAADTAPPGSQPDQLGGRGPAGSRDETQRANTAAAPQDAIGDDVVVVLGSDDDDADVPPGASKSYRRMMTAVLRPSSAHWQRVEHLTHVDKSTLLHLMEGRLAGTPGCCKVLG